MNGSDDSSPALLEWPLDRTLLIEASAGTGKTWTITALYVRQIVEAGIPVENVLVVTYTEAATKELRSRIRERLVTLREALDSGGIDDPFCLDMLAGIDDGIAARRALDRAISGFDEAAIYTIHGFCQRVLSESAFESATSLDAEVLTSEQDLRQEICDDFWRHEVLRQPRPVVEQLVADNATPETLGGWIDDSASRSWVEVIEPGPAACADYESLASQFEDAFETVRRLWQAHREEVSELLLDSKALNRNAYRLASVHAWLDAMDGMLKNRGLRRPLFDHFDRFTRDRLARSVNKGQQPPRHAFFDACTALEELRRQMDDAMAGRVALLKARLREYVMSELASRKAARRLHSFDDLLALVRGALDGPAGKRLARKLRDRYPVAMIDEFQDTDPVQLEIFRRIYDAPGASRIFVGDPKQSIYSFRGADLFAYLAGRELATRRETLARNYRSDPALVRAVNALFTRLDNPFVFDMLEYPEIEGVGTNTARLRVDGKAEARLQFRFLERERFDVRGKTIGKGRASLAICRDVANRIGSLLAPEGGDVTLDGRPLSGGDIAVLVRTHDQARQIHEILTQAGVPSVRQGAGSVFASAEAEAVEQVLRAVSEPGRERPLRAALVSDIIGMNADELVAAAASADRWEGIVEQFREYHLLWRDHGFMSMFRTLLVEYDVYARTLSREDGERAMTNISHLAELLHAHAHDGDGSIEQSIKWLAEMRRTTGGENEEAELRLESDADRVQILTVHRSKGLEYPVVFCPFLWHCNARRQKNGEALFHDPDDGYRAKLDLGSPDIEAHRQYAFREELAESIRLLYVALTRAGQRCVVHWGAMRDAGVSALAWVLCPVGRTGGNEWTAESFKSRFESCDDDKLRAALRALRDEHPDAVGLACVNPDEPLGRVRLARSPSHSPEALRFERALRSSWRVTSFSALASGAPDDVADRDESVREPVAQDVESRFAETSIHRYPRGARTGLCWHELFEKLDFTAVDEDSTHDVVMRTLDSYGIDAAWAPATESMIRHTVAADLDPPNGLRLCDVPFASRLSELAFFYPVSALDAARLAKLFAASGSPHAADYARSVERLQFTPVRGYVRGFVDLVFEYDGRYYIADYKSNWLGPTAASYGRERLSSAMAREGYFLQYLLYVVALHRYLESRLPDYDIDRHFGGVYYLFLRGLDSGAADGRGVFFDRPPADLVRDLDDHLGRLT